MSRRLVLWAVAAVVACSIAAGALGAALVGLRDDQDAIQTSRAQSVRETCREQNGRHDDVIDRVDRLILERLTGSPVPKEIPPAQVDRLIAAETRQHPVLAAQALEGRKATVFLINGLAPKRNCERRVRKLVGEVARGG